MTRSPLAFVALVAIATLAIVGIFLARRARADEGAAPDHGGHAHDATVTHSFEDVETWAALFDDPGRDGWQMPNAVAAALPLSPGSIVLDIGAGTGYFNEAFAARVRPGGRVYAADVEPNMIAHMLGRARREATPEVFPLLVPHDEPRAPEPVDAAFICDTIHHINDRIEYLKKVRAILKPSGVVAVIDFKPGDIPVGPPPEHRIPKELVIEEMEAAGFRLDREESILPYQYFLIFEMGG